MHADAASLDRYLGTAGPRFARFGDLLELSSIQLYGDPSAEAIGRLQEKLTLLGSGDVVVHVTHAGFSRPARAAAP